MSAANDRLGSFASRAVPGCSITRGCQTRMTRRGFAQLCERYRDQQDGYCKEVCRGERPPAELEFIEIEKHMEENMGTIKYAQGTCQLCGKSANLKKCLGKEVCSGCDFIWRAINGKPEMVFTALIEKMGTAWAQERLPGDWVSPVLVAEQPPVDQDTLKALRDTLAELQASYAELAEMNAGQRQELTSLAQQRDDLTNRLVEIYEMNEKLETGASAATGNKAESNRDTVLLDLALGLLDGTVTGVDVTSLKTLRQ